MVKYVPEVSSWQLLFVRCSMQVRIKSGDLRMVEVPLASHSPAGDHAAPCVSLWAKHNGHSWLGYQVSFGSQIFGPPLSHPSSKTQVESSCSRDPWRVSSSHDIWGSFQVFSTWHFFTLKIIQHRMPLGDCTAIFFSSPAFTMVLSFIILKWVGLNFETFLDTQWSSGITVGWYASLLHLLCWLGYQTLFLI